MGELIDLARRRSKPALTPEEKQFDAFIFAMRGTPLPALVSALVAARDLHELSRLVDELAAFIIYSTSRPDPA
jgi:hypothetical protein